MGGGGEASEAAAAPSKAWRGRGEAVPGSLSCKPTDLEQEATLGHAMLGGGVLGVADHGGCPPSINLLCSWWYRLLVQAIWGTGQGSAGGGDGSVGAREEGTAPCPQGRGELRLQEPLVTRERLKSQTAARAQLRTLLLQIFCFSVLFESNQRDTQRDLPPTRLYPRVG